MLDLPAVPAGAAPAPAPAPAPAALAGDALARMNPPLPCDDELAPPAAPGCVLDGLVVLLPAPLADWRHPVIVTAFADSLDWLALGVLGVCEGGVDGGVDGGCWAPTPTASAALSIVPKMI